MVHLGSGRSRCGTLVWSGTRAPTRNCISGPSKTGMPLVRCRPWRGRLRSSTGSPAERAKSTITSARSAGPSRTELRRTGFGIRPLSLAIWISGAPLESAKS